MKLVWKDADDVVARVGEPYMIKVLGNSGAGTSVRFGLTGNGTSPNYQVEFKDSERPKLLFGGLSHQEWPGDEKEFDDDRLSKPPFSYEDLFAAFLRRYRSPKGTSPSK